MGCRIEVKRLTFPKRHARAGGAAKLEVPELYFLMRPHAHLQLQLEAEAAGPHLVHPNAIL